MSQWHGTLHYQSSVSAASVPEFLIGTAPSWVRRHPLALGPCLRASTTNLSTDWGSSAPASPVRAILVGHMCSMSSRLWFNPLLGNVCDERSAEYRVQRREGPDVEGCRGAALTKSVRNNFRTRSGIVTRTATLQSKWASPRLGSPSEPQRLLARGLRTCPGPNPARRSSLRCACRRAMPRRCERRQSTAGSASQN